MTQTGPGMSNEDGYIEEVLCSEGANQLRSYCAADLRFRFAYATSRRSHDGSRIIII